MLNLIIEILYIAYLCIPIWIIIYTIYPRNNGNRIISDRGLENLHRDILNRNIRLIGIGGKIGSGKSTACEILNRRFSNSKILNFADSLKNVVGSLLNIDPQILYTTEGKSSYSEYYCDWERLSDSGREHSSDSEVKEATNGRLLQILGGLLREEWKENIWVILLLRRILCENEKTGVNIFLIGDVRYPNELDTIKRVNGASIYLVRGETGACSQTGRDSNHSSETSVVAENFAQVIDNNGTLGDLETILNSLDL